MEKIVLLCMWKGYGQWIPPSTFGTTNGKNLAPVYVDMWSIDSVGSGGDVEQSTLQITLPSHIFIIVL